MQVTTTVMPPASPAAAAACTRRQRRPGRCRRMFAFVEDACLGRSRPVNPRGLRRADRAAGRPGARNLHRQPPERGVGGLQGIQEVELAVQFGPILDRSPEQISKALAPADRGGRRVRGVDYLAALEARKDIARRWRTSSSTTVRSSPRPRGAPLPRASDHRRTRVLRLVDLSRRAGRDASAAGGRWPAARACS